MRSVPVKGPTAFFRIYIDLSYHTAVPLLSVFREQRCLFSNKFTDFGHSCDYISPKRGTALPLSRLHDLKINRKVLTCLLNFLLSPSIFRDLRRYSCKSAPDVA